MTKTELEALVQKLAEHGCKLLIEHDGYDYVASALAGMWSPHFRDSAIQATAPTLDAALALLAEAVEKAEWSDPSPVQAGRLKAACGEYTQQVADGKTRSTYKQVAGGGRAPCSPGS